MEQNKALSSVAEVIRDLQSGKMIIVVDDHDRENEGDLICAGQFVTPQVINFMATHARGLLCLSLETERLRELDLQPMVVENADPHSAAFTVSVDASSHLGVSTGISALDRSRTIQACINAKTRPSDLNRPGHVFPLQARQGGVLVRAGHTEASIDLMKLAGLYPAALICQIQNRDGSMARLTNLLDYGQKYGLRIVSIADLINFRLRTECLVRREAVTELPTKFGQFKAHAYRNLIDNSEHVAIVKGNPSEFSKRETLMRVHSECLIGDALGSLRCDCRSQLHQALTMIDREGSGVLLYLQQEDRGMGMINKLKAYSLQDTELDTVEANQEPSFRSDLQNYAISAQILHDLQLRKVRLLTNNPQKISGLKRFGLDVVDTVPLIPEVNSDNASYLIAKANKLGHLIVDNELEDRTMLSRYKADVA